ncbi:hypothetical protein OCS_01326 [Ophiocordyceps sinensis CO18]|uniref:Uncharacterized protein n=1 Tax=Ophiocordyceps sinensis (strain Co18 / CGMCC 3.14243) TaxID=911162 RepID=T5ABX5_OPHSC|nr:hypothetical protein OCS_01326 [Ophiocordyceps sinensis CO18]
MFDHGHVRIHSYCGACGFRFDPGDKIVALVGRDGSFEAARPAGAFAAACHCDNTHGHSWIFCRHIRCRQCVGGPESATLHADCLSVFQARSLAVDAESSLARLWIAAAWKSPWLGAPALHLLPSVDVLAGLGHAAAAWNLPQLPQLPPELASMIHQRSRHSPLWRYSLVSELACALSEAANCEIPTVCLNSVECWQRGQPLKTAKATHDCADDSLVRITIDSRGIQRIERLPAEELQSSVPQLQSNSITYVVEEAKALIGVKVEFQLQYARLILHPGSKGFKIWDTPSPPSLQKWTINPTIPPCRLRTIHLRNCFALTFFVSSGSTLAIHGHTRQRPFAQSTFDTLWPLQQRFAAWVYVPIPKGIAALGLRNSRGPFRPQTNLLVRIINIPQITSF